MIRSTYTLAAPSWLEPPPTEERSLDPLGFLAPAEMIADRLLPGVTVATRRIRYLSFLCWAIREAEGNRTEIDRLEVALSVGEHRRHFGNGDECRFLGRLLLRRRELEDDDPVPTRLHVQTARMLYSGLLRSCGLMAPDGTLTHEAKRIADEFDRDMPRRRPRRVVGCERMPCLSMIRSKEKRWLREALLISSKDAVVRNATRRGLSGRIWRQLLAEDVAGVLTAFLPKNRANGDATTSALHDAAKLEITAMPLTRLFFRLYENEGVLPRRVHGRAAFRAFRIRSAPGDMLADVFAHLRKAERLGGTVAPDSTHRLFDVVLKRHREAKPESPWVDDAWRPLRLGLQPQRLQQLHGYRLPSFAALLRDLGEI